MKKTMIAACAAAISGLVLAADTNYTAYASSKALPWPAEIAKHVAADATLTTEEAKSAALREADEALVKRADERARLQELSCFPKAARASLEAGGVYAENVREAMLAECAYALPGKELALGEGHPLRIDFLLQKLWRETSYPSGVKREILVSCLPAVRHTVRTGGESFAGPEGAKRVRKLLDRIGDALNAPRFAGLEEAFAAIGVAADVGFVRAKLPEAADAAALRDKVLDGQVPLTRRSQRDLLLALGFEAYNRFVRDYNGK